MADFNPPKVIIDQAEYDYLKGIEVLHSQEPTTTASETHAAFIEMYQTILGVTIARLSTVDRRLLDQYLVDTKVTWTMFEPNGTRRFPAKFVLEDIPFMPKAKAHAV